MSVKYFLSLGLSSFFMHTHTHTHSHTRTLAGTHAHPLTHTHTHSHTPTLTRTHALFLCVRGTNFQFAFMRKLNYLNDKKIDKKVGESQNKK